MNLKTTTTLGERLNRSVPDYPLYTPTELRAKLAHYGISINTFARPVGMANSNMHNLLRGRFGQSRLARIRIGEVIAALDALDPDEDEEPEPIAAHTEDQ